MALIRALAALLLLTSCTTVHVDVSPPLVTYDHDFSAKVTDQLAKAKTESPELAQVVVDYLKLRCALKPDLPNCKDLLSTH